MMEWNFLSGILFILLTLVIYLTASWLYKRLGRITLLQPLVLALLLLIPLLYLCDIAYADYFAGAYPLHWLLGPATIALAVPLYLNAKRIRQFFVPIMLTILTAASVTVLLAIVLAWLLGASELTLLSLATKSITTPVAMVVSAEIGGQQSLASAFIIVAGLLGGVLGPLLFRWMKLQDESIKGLVLGLLSHAIGTAKAFEISDKCGAYSALAMGMTALLTAIILPLAVYLF